LKQVDADVLNVGYAEAGPAKGSRGHPAAWLALRHRSPIREAPKALADAVLEVAGH
jgi:hypothetical protein